MRDDEQQMGKIDMTATKKFHVRTLLTVTTGRLLTKSQGARDNGIADLYDLLGWMTNDEPFTHQLPRFSKECEPWLLRWFPELAQANESLWVLDQKIKELGPENGVEFWLTNMLVIGLRADYDVPKIPRDDHQQKAPYDELVEMRGTDDGIVIL